MELTCNMTSKKSAFRLLQKRMPVLCLVGLLHAVSESRAVDLPPLEPGSARRWQADVQVSTYSTVNTRTGNMLTMIPIVSWSGRGPDMNFNLYHNSANWDHTLADTAHFGFFLGPGWTTSYSHQLIINSSVSATMIWADGTRDEWTLSTGVGTPPVGVFQTLERVEESPDVWHLKTKDQTVYEFSEDYLDGLLRLSRIIDASNNQSTITYDCFTHDKIDMCRFDFIEAAGRSIEFHYDDTEGPTWGRLIEIEDPGEADQPVSGISIDDRTWTISYDDSKA